MFPGSRVQPLSLPELYAWAVELRIQVRQQIMQPVEEFIVPSPVLPMRKASKATETSHRQKKEAPAQTSPPAEQEASENASGEDDVSKSEEMDEESITE